MLGPDLGDALAPGPLRQRDHPGHAPPDPGVYHAGHVPRPGQVTLADRRGEHLPGVQPRGGAQRTATCATVTWPVPQLAPVPLRQRAHHQLAVALRVGRPRSPTATGRAGPPGCRELEKLRCWVSRADSPAPSRSTTSAITPTASRPARLGAGSTSPARSARTAPARTRPRAPRRAGQPGRDREHEGQVVRRAPESRRKPAGGSRCR